jgi:hypothetical protein
VIVLFRNHRDVTRTRIARLGESGDGAPLNEGEARA